MNEIVLSEQQYTRFERYLLNAIGFLLSQEFAKKAPVDTGNLKNSIRYEVIEGKVNILMSRHGLYVEYGTAPHIITPKEQGKSLAFKVAGKTVFAKKVYHPGTAPQPFIRPVLFNDFQAIVNKAKELALIEVLSA